MSKQNINNIKFLKHQIKNKEKEDKIKHFEKAINKIRENQFENYQGPGVFECFISDINFIKDKIRLF